MRSRHPAAGRRRGAGWSWWPPAVRGCCWPPRAATATTATSCTSCGPAPSRRSATSTSRRSRRCSRTRLDVLLPGSLVGLRTPSALMAGLVVLLTGLLAREFGADAGRAGAGRRRAWRCRRSLLAVGHLLSTSTLDLLVWTALSLADGAGAARLAGRGLAGSPPGWSPGSGCRTSCCRRSCWPRCWSGSCSRGPRPALRATWPWLGGLLALLICGAEPGLAGRARVPAAGAVGRRSPPAARAPASPGTCSSRSSWCWSARCWCRCGRSGCGGWRRDARAAALALFRRGLRGARGRCSW